MGGWERRRKLGKVRVGKERKIMCCLGWVNQKSFSSSLFIVHWLPYFLGVFLLLVGVCELVGLVVFGWRGIWILGKRIYIREVSTLDHT